MYYNNKRLALSIFWVVLGIVLIALSVLEILKDTVYGGMGGALVAIGILQIARIVKYRMNKEYRENVDTQVQDERNKFLHMKSWAWTGYIVVLVEAIGVIGATIIGNETVQHIFSYSICLILVVYWCVYMILSKKY